MKKNVIGTVIAAAMMTAAMTVTSFAGTWEQTGNGWMWNAGCGNYARDGWAWCDGDNDGVSECYYFDANGICLINAQAPNGYTVNENGAWVENGTVVVRTADMDWDYVIPNDPADEFTDIEIH